MYFCCNTTDAVAVTDSRIQLQMKLSLCCLLANDAPDEVIFHKMKITRSCMLDVDSDSITALMWAVKKERIKVILKMFEYRFEPNECDWNRYTALHYAVKTGNARICQLLINRGAHVNTRGGPFHSTPLHEACKDNLMDIIQLLISCGANREAIDKRLKIPEDYLPEPFDALKECYKEYFKSRSSSMTIRDIGSNSGHQRKEKSSTDREVYSISTHSEFQ